MLGQQEIRKRFTAKALTRGGLDSVRMVRSSAMDLAGDFDAMLPDGREKSLALTALEEASMWAVKAVSNDPNNQLAPE